ncbi:MAG: hypothetical protein H0U74_14515 [Bradymonadaceae bacterium]|nr:hypothetical protein [Lujinxingiaceae bacterium]
MFTEWNRQIARHIKAACLGLGCVLLLAACANYGWANRDEPSAQAGDAQTVDVSTILIRADQGLDVVFLTRALVGAIQREGIDNAAWNAGRAAAVSVSCAVEDAEVLGMAQHMVAHITLACMVHLPPDAPLASLQARGSAAASTAFAAREVITANQRLEELATLEAIERLAPRIAQAIRAFEPLTIEDQVQ